MKGALNPATANCDTGFLQYNFRCQFDNL